jgi:hypothetical protein
MAKTSSSSWWTTLPGILTGLAALITAVTGVIVAYQHLNPTSEKTATPSSVSSVSSVESASPKGTASGSNAIEIAQPALSEVKLDSGTMVIRILKMELEPYNAEKKALKFSVRYTNNTPYDANFWVRSFRLLVDDIPQPPTNSLNEIVAGNSAKVGDVVFEIPVAVNQVVFQIIGLNDKTQIPISLTATQ